MRNEIAFWENSFNFYEMIIQRRRAVMSHNELDFRPAIPAQSIREASWSLSNIYFSLIFQITFSRSIALLHASNLSARSPNSYGLVSYPRWLSVTLSLKELCSLVNQRSSLSNSYTFSMGILREAPCNCGDGSGQSTVKTPSFDNEDLICSTSVPSGRWNSLLYSR